MDDKFETWFHSKLDVHSFPKINNMFFNPRRYQYVINVSDEYYPVIDEDILEKGIRTFWFPMNEAKSDAGLNSIYGAMVILYQAYENDAAVYLHCHAGSNRSPVVQAAFYYMMTYTHYEDFNSGFINMLARMCARGFLPELHKMEKFLICLREQLDKFKGEPMGGTLDNCKIDME